MSGSARRWPVHKARARRASKTQGRRARRTVEGRTAKVRLALCTLHLAAVEPIHLFFQPHCALCRRRRRRERRRRHNVWAGRTNEEAERRECPTRHVRQEQLRRRREPAVVRTVEVAVQRNGNGHEGIGCGVMLAAHIREHLLRLLQQARELVRLLPVRRSLGLVHKQRVRQLHDCPAQIRPCMT